jgi:hypothetical protein
MVKLDFNAFQIAERKALRTLLTAYSSRGTPAVTNEVSSIESCSHNLTSLMLEEI